MSTPGSKWRAADASGSRCCQGCGAALAVDNVARLCVRCLREQQDQLRTPPARLPAGFFETAEFRAAFESQHIGMVFKAYRFHPYYLQLFGKALNQELFGRWVGLSQPQVSKLEKGKPEHDLENLRNYARILHLPPQLLWFDLVGQSRRATSVRGSGTDPETDVSVSHSVAELTSHKFIPMFVGPAAVNALVDHYAMAGVRGEWLACHAASIAGKGGSCNLYAWPFGVAMYHLVEYLRPASLAEVAVWRHLSYLENMRWAAECVAGACGTGPRDEIYVLGTYWVTATSWEGAVLDTALRMLCVPEVLIERDDADHKPSVANAGIVEESLFREGFDDPGIEEFGYQGVSRGLASWSGVVYEPLVKDHALVEQDLISCELAVQATWSYCSYIRSEIERGRDPDVPSEFGWRFLRGLRSRLTTERPQETPQHRSLREAIVSTSGLTTHLAQALEALRETEGMR